MDASLRWHDGFLFWYDGFIYLYGSFIFWCDGLLLLVVTSIRWYDGFLCWCDGFLCWYDAADWFIFFRLAVLCRCRLFGKLCQNFLGGWLAGPLHRRL